MDVQENIILPQPWAWHWALLTLLTQGGEPMYVLTLALAWVINVFPNRSPPSTAQHCLNQIQLSTKYLDLVLGLVSYNNFAYSSVPIVESS